MASGKKIESAKKTYTDFIGYMKWGTGITVIVAAIVILLISN